MMAEATAHDQTYPGLARLRVALLTLALPLVVLSGASVGVAALLPWQDPTRSGDRPAAWAVAALLTVAVWAVAAPAWSALRRHTVPRTGAAVVGMAAAAVALFVAQSRLRDVSALEGIRVAGPLSLAGLITLFLGWVLVLVAERLDRLSAQPRTNWRYLTASAVVLAVLAAGTVWFVDWWRFGRLIDHSTSATPRPAGAALPPSQLGTQRWTADVAGNSFAVVGGDVVVGEQSGVSVLDASTGAPRWHYRYRQRFALAVTPSADGSVIAVEYDQDALVGLDRATGRQLWWLNLPSGLSDKVTSIDAGAGGLVLATGTRLAGVSPRSGAVTWQAPAAGLGQRCEFNGVVVTGATAVSLVACGPTAHRTLEVIGLDVATGRQVWRQQPAAWQQVQASLDLFTLSVASAGRVFANGPLNGQSLLLDAATGRTLVTTPPHEDLDAVVLLGDTLYLFGTKDTVDRFSVSSGAPVGSWPAPVSSMVRGVALAGDDMVVFGDAPGGTAVEEVLVARDGSTVASRQVPFAVSGCSSCEETPVGAAAGPGVLVVATRYTPLPDDAGETRPDRLRLTALG